MAHDVFISYASTDKTVADAVCSQLETIHHIRCWIAPRDIIPGASWAESIIDALDQAKIMVLIFSSNANASMQIEREVERAVHKGINIIPLRIENTTPTKTLEYFISAPHWLDALSTPLELHINRLADSVKALLARPSHAPVVHTAAVAAPAAEPAVAPEPPPPPAVAPPVAAAPPPSSAAAPPVAPAAVPTVQSTQVAAPAPSPMPAPAPSRTPPAAAAPDRAAGQAAAKAGPKPVQKKSSLPMPALVGGALAIAALIFVGLRLRNSTPTPSEAVESQATPAAAGSSEPAASSTSASTAAPGDVQPAPAATATTAAASAAASAKAPAAKPSTTAAASQPKTPAAAAAPASSSAAAAGAAAPAAARSAAAAPAAARAGEAGSLFVDFINNLSDGSVVLEVDDQKRWTEKLGLNMKGAGAGKILFQRDSERLSAELKVAGGDHHLKVTTLNPAGDVLDSNATDVYIDPARPVTLRIRMSRRNKLQLDHVVGQSTDKQ